MTITFDMSATPYQLFLMASVFVFTLGTMLFFLRYVWDELSSSLRTKKDIQIVLFEVEDRLTRLDALLLKIEDRTETKSVAE